MANLKQRIRVLEISATGRGQNVPTLADFYASIERGEDPNGFGVGKPLSHFYGGYLPASARPTEVAAPRAGAVN